MSAAQFVTALIVRSHPLPYVLVQFQQQATGGTWEFPSTKVQDGETHQMALTRICEQELKVNVRVGPHLDTVRFSLTRMFDVYLYVVNMVGVDECLLERFAWMNIDHAVEKLPCAPSIYAFYPSIKLWIAHQNSTGPHNGGHVRAIFSQHAQTQLFEKTGR